MADSTTNLPVMTSGQAQKEVTYNLTVDALSPAALYGRNALTSAYSTWGYFGGRFLGLSIPNGTILLTVSATNYIEADNATGVVSKNTTGFTAVGKKPLYKVVMGATQPISWEDRREATAPLQLVQYQLSCSDLTTALTTGTNNGYFRAPSAFTLTGVRSSLLVASSSGLPTVNIKKNGTTIFSTNLSIDATELTSVTAATPAVLTANPTAVADDDLITVDITVAGTGAKGLIVTLLGHL